MRELIAIAMSIVPLALLFGLYQSYRIDKELRELEKQEPGYVKGRTSIPGPR